MKKKIIIIISAVVLLIAAVLFVPIPKGSYDDGGTEVYEALTYKLIKWNRLYEGDLCYNSTRFYFGEEKNKSIDELWLEINPDADEKTCVFTATVAEIDESSILVKPDEGSQELNSADEICIPKTAADGIEIESGDKIEIEYDGNIAEVYPAMIDNVSLVKVIEKSENFSVSSPGSTMKSSEKSTKPEEDGKKYSENNKVQFVRSHCSETKTAFPYAVVIRSKAELDSYYNDNKTVWGFSGKANGISFNEAIKEYDDSFFENNALVFAVTREGSGSITYKSASIDGNNINVEKVVPEVNTCDMAYWHIIFEVEKTDPILSGKININITEG